MGVAVWPMVELEADDALASAARLAAARRRASRRSASGRPTRTSRSACVGDRVVQVDRRSGQIRDADGVRAKFGVDPALIPDFLALVGDAADGYPGIPRHRRGRARRGSSNGTARSRTFPPSVLGENRELRAAVQAPRDAADGRGPVRRRRGAALARPDAEFAAVARQLDDERLADRAVAAASR